jgi:DNA-binding response OmpR family regulator
MIGPFQFRPARRLLLNMQNGERTRLTEKEAAVLKFLYRADGPVPRTALLNEVWGYAGDATTHTVETHIYRLRRKIEPNADSISLLVSESGGYRLRLGSPPRSDHRHRDASYLARETGSLV